MPKLILKERGKETEQTFEFEREEISFGRADTNSVPLESTGVSRKHAVIIPSGGAFFIKDAGSKGGTLVNGIKVPHAEKYILKHNDIITIENFDIKFLLIDEMLNQSFNDVTDSDILEVKLLKKVLKALDRESIPSIEVLNGVAEGKKAFLTDDVEEITIGRDPMCDFPIEEYVISRKHAKIIKKWGGIVIENMGSKNGVFLNNRKVEEEALHDGDRIALGTIVLMFRNPKEVDVNELGKKMTEEKIAQHKKTEAEEKKKVELEAKVEEEEEELSQTAQAPTEAEQKKLAKLGAEREYPTPHTRKQRIKFSFTELSIMAAGILVLLFALIMILNIVLS